MLAVHRAKSFDYRVLHLVLRQLVARDAAAAARDPMRVLAHGGRAVHGEAALHPQGVSLPWEGLQVGSAGQSRGEKGRGSKRGAEHVRGCEVGHAGKRSKQGPAGVLAGGEAAAEELGQTGAEESEGDHRKAGVGRRKDGQKGSCGEDGGSPEGSTAEQSEEEGDEAGDGDLVLSFLRLDELLVDIGDDLTDYEVRCVAFLMYDLMRGSVRCAEAADAAQGRLMRRIHWWSLHTVCTFSCLSAGKEINLSAPGVTNNDWKMFRLFLRLCMHPCVHPCHSTCSHPKHTPLLPFPFSQTSSPLCRLPFLPSFIS